VETTWTPPGVQATFAPQPRPRLEPPLNLLAISGSLRAASYNTTLLDTLAPLKNAIDWASRDSVRSPFVAKPVGIVGASAGAVGTARVQGHLAMVLLGMLAQVFPWPEVLVAHAGSKIGDGRVTDLPTREHLARFLAAFASWAAAVPPIGC